MELAKKAVAIEPSNSGALTALGVVELFVGNVEQAQKTYEEVDRVDPLFGGGQLTFLLVAFARGDDEGIAKYGSKLRATKGLYGLLALIFLATQAQEQGDHATAEKILRSLAASARRPSLAEPMVAALKSRAARSKAADLLKAEADRDPTFDPMSIYVLIGAYDQFLDAANTQVLAGSDDPRVGRMMFFVWHVVAKGQGSNPKLKELFRNLGLVDFWKKHGWPDRCRAKGEDDFECS
jgi:tetratricopeptide (TPR) repeat protein